jgi:hypothetical protein
VSGGGVPNAPETRGSRKFVQEDGKPHIVKRMDRPHMGVIPEIFGGLALPRKELKEAAQDLTSNEAGVIVIGEPTIEKRFDKAVTRAAKVVKRSLNATTDEIASERKKPSRRLPSCMPVLGAPITGGAALPLDTSDIRCLCPGP